MHELILVVLPLLGILYLTSVKQMSDQAVTKRLRFNPDRKNTAVEPRGSYPDTENNLAYFNTPIPRHRQQGLSMYEAEAAQNKHEIQDELTQARKDGNALRQVEILARYHRSKDQALKNVANDYDDQHGLIQIRRNEAIGASKRVMETIADNPKLAGISAWVPHARSQPIPVSFGKHYWRPNQYMTPGYTHV